MARRTQILLLGPLLAVLGACSGPPRPATAPSPEAIYREAAGLRGAALAAMDAGEWRSAVDLLDRLEAILPDNLIAPLNLAVCHLQTGDLVAARRAAERAGSLAPDNPRLLYALARIHDAAQERQEWQSTLDHYAAVHPRDPRPHFLRLRSLEARGEAAAAYRAADEAVRRDYENLVLLVDRLAVAAQAGLFAETRSALDAVEDRLGGFEGSAADYAEAIRAAIDQGTISALGPPAQVLRNILRPTGLYRQHLIPLTGSGSVSQGVFVQLDFEPALPKSIQGGQDIAFGFTELPSISGLAGIAAAGDLRLASLADRDAALVVHGPEVASLELTPEGWQFSSLLPLSAGERLWSRLDIDNDGSEDWLVEGGSQLRLHAGALPPRALFDFAHRLEHVTPVDVDHDGDLDLVASTGDTTLYLQNNGDGSWLENNALLGALAEHRTSDLVSVDFDDDGDLDLVALAGGRLWLLSNPRQGPLEDVTASWQVDAIDGADARLVVEDFDADGLFDILVWGARGARLLGNGGNRFTPGALPEIAGKPWAAVETADFDNDGDRDLLVALADGSVALLRNRRSEFVAESLALRAHGVAQLLAGDFDGDGDLDVLRRGALGLGYWRNDGGSLNHWLRVRLRGRSENNSKNNSQGLFVRLESRTAGSFQALLGNGGVNHLGLGSHRQVDALRVVWTNGLSQSWAALAADQTLDEEQVLKGSCPFLYTWNGRTFEFVTDLMWKSPLGMTLADGTPAPHASAMDFVLIPGDRLVPAGDELWLQVTEELWETIYIDRQQLYAVDHPTELELVVDEKFTMPPHPVTPPMHWIARRLPPASARDELGRDVLDEISARDGRHVGNLPLSRYQGVTLGHALELRFVGLPAGERLRLVLHGWTFPTDTSINFALAQDRFPAPSAPRLELATASGWTTLVPSIGFPSGKRKAVVVELTDLLPQGDVTLRLTTEMQIYWDSASLAVGDPELEPRITVLEPRTGDLHYRGFSRLYRQADTAPHLFDYAQVETAPRFRDLRGRYTRFGPVGELLRATDDRYVVMNAGDELTVRFATGDLPPLPPGWQRDYVLFTDGWVKDGDIHTARSQTVEPLPFHDMRAYPLAGSRPPDATAHRRWLDEYQTRLVDDVPFRNQLKAPEPELGERP